MNNQTEPAPNIATTISIEAKHFKLVVLAYRPLTEAEGRQALAAWLKDNNLKEVPERIEAHMLSLYGFENPCTPS